MTPLSPERRMLFAATPLLAVGLVVYRLAWWLSGSDAASLAAGGVLVAASIFVVVELSLIRLGVERPVDRMLFTMLLRGFAGLAAVTAGVVVLGADPKLVVSIATPLYLSLVAGEVLSATGRPPVVSRPAKEAR